MGEPSLPDHGKLVVSDVANQLGDAMVPRRLLQLLLELALDVAQLAVGMLEIGRLLFLLLRTKVKVRPPQLQHTIVLGVFALISLFRVVLHIDLEL